MITIFKKYEEYQLNKPAVIDNENFVKYILPRADQKKVDISDDQENVIELLYKLNKIKISDVINELGIARTTAKRVLNDLIEKKVIESVGKGRGTHYQIKSKGHEYT